MEKKREKDLKDLSQLIVTAITKDTEVMKALADLKRRKVIESTTLLGLALKINDLLEMSGSVSDDNGAQGSDKTGLDGHPMVQMSLRSETHTVSTPHQPGAKKEALIDGKKLSDHEILFEEWSIANFDEDEWLKKTGLIW